jgi:hypothetical protein
MTCPMPVMSRPREATSVATSTRTCARRRRAMSAEAAAWAGRPPPGAARTMGAGSSTACAQGTRPARRLPPPRAPSAAPQASRPSTAATHLAGRKVSQRALALPLAQAAVQRHRPHVVVAQRLRHLVAARLALHKHDGQRHLRPAARRDRHLLLRVGRVQVQGVGGRQGCAAGGGRQGGVGARGRSCWPPSWAAGADRGCTA